MAGLLLIGSAVVTLLQSVLPFERHFSAATEAAWPASRS